MSDRIAVMSHGKVLQMGAGSRDIRTPDKSLRGRFYWRDKLLEGKVKSVTGDKAIVTIPAWNQELTGITTAQVQVGDDVAVSIRPEKIQLIDEPITQQNSMEGVVVRSTYIGSDTHVYLDVRGQTNQGMGIRIVFPPLTRTAFYRKGEKVWLTLLPEKYSGPAQGLGMLIRLHKITSTYQVIRVYALFRY